MAHWIDRILSDRTMRDGRDAFNYTMNAAGSMRRVIWSDEFYDRDGEMIYEYLQEKVIHVSFGNYLKRYLYASAGFSKPAAEVRDQEYKELITDAFLMTRTPKSFHETSTTLGVLINGWLTASTVSRETVFLLGFAFQMPVKDVSGFLMKANCEQDFNFKNPEEVIFWYCLNNGLSAREARRLLLQYEESGFCGAEFDGEKTVSVRSKVREIHSEQELFEVLAAVKTLQSGTSFSRTALEEFRILLDRTKEAISVYYEATDEYDPSGKERGRRITEADVEKVLYSGIPVDGKGNLYKASLSDLHKDFTRYRLSRMRLGRILSGKAAVTRYDLITLNFLLTALTVKIMGSEEFRTFADETDSLLERCFMGSVNPSNPYEAYILICLLSVDPLAAFSEVWEISYGNQ